LRAEAEERERLLSSTQQLLKIAQEQLFKGASSQGETRGQMCELHNTPNQFKTAVVVELFLQAVRPP
jgi:hypothetical protein